MIKDIAFKLLKPVYLFLRIVWTPFVFLFGVVTPVYKEKKHLVIAQCTLFSFLILSGFLARNESFGAILFLLCWIIGIGLGVTFMYWGAKFEAEDVSGISETIPNKKQIRAVVATIPAILIIFYAAWAGMKFDDLWIPIFLSCAWIYLVSGIYAVDQFSDISILLYVIAFLWVASFTSYILKNEFEVDSVINIYSLGTLLIIIIILTYEGILAIKVDKKIFIAIWHSLLILGVIFFNIEKLRGVLLSGNLNLLELLLILLIVHAIFMRSLTIFKRSNKRGRS